MNKINKTIILLATAGSFYAPISFADSEQFYVKANTGYSKFMDVKIEDDCGNKLGKYKSKSGSGFFGIGVGYYIMDNIRIDIAFDYFSDKSHKKSWSHPDGDFGEAKIKGNVSSITLNGYVDLFDVSDIKIFTGAGCGLARTRGKGSYSERWRGEDKPVEKIKFKDSNNFTYALHLGASTKIMDNFHADLTYSFRGFGDLKHKDEDGDKFELPYKGHHIALGVRYDI